MSFNFRCNQEIIEESFLPTLKTIISAPLSSPLAEVNADNVAELMVQLTNSKLLMENQNNNEEQITVSFVCLFLKHDLMSSWYDKILTIPNEEIHESLVHPLLKFES